MYIYSWSLLIRFFLVFSICPYLGNLPREALPLVVNNNCVHIAGYIQTFQLSHLLQSMGHLIPEEGHLY